MSPNEIAFLNSLLTDEEETAASHSVCPEPSILWSLTQEELKGSAMVEDLRRHSAHCSSCRDLVRRLHAFSHSVQQEGAVDQTQDWAEAKPRLNRWLHDYLQKQPKASLKQRPRWSFVANFSWGMPLAAAGCAAILVMAAVFATRHGAAPQAPGSDDLASISRHGETEHPSPPVSDDKAISLADRKETNARISGDENARTLTFFDGEHMRLSVTEVEMQLDGSYRLSGRLMPLSPGPDTFETAEVSGVFTSAQPDAPLNLTVREAAMGNNSYHAPMSGSDDGITVIFLKKIGDVPSAGQTLEVQVVRGQTLTKIQP
jgi:hypothetical protein